LAEESRTGTSLTKQRILPKLSQLTLNQILKSITLKEIRKIKRSKKIKRIVLNGIQQK
jgi:hypothetical protein